MDIQQANNNMDYNPDIFRLFRLFRHCLGFRVHQKGGAISNLYVTSLGPVLVVRE
jgi:hypothetical protein